jgi:hypothetical protein
MHVDVRKVHMRPARMGAVCAPSEHCLVLRGRQPLPRRDDVHNTHANQTWRINMSKDTCPGLDPVVCMCGSQGAVTHFAWATWRSYRQQ